MNYGYAFKLMGYFYVKYAWVHTVVAIISAIVGLCFLKAGFDGTNVPIFIIIGVFSMIGSFFAVQKTLEKVGKQVAAEYKNPVRFNFKLTGEHCASVALSFFLVVALVANDPVPVVSSLCIAFAMTFTGSIGATFYYIDETAGKV